MEKKLYSELSAVGHFFYKTYFPHEKIAVTLDRYLKKYNCTKIVFFGALVHVAKILQGKGYELTFVDYTEEMVEEARTVLDDVSFIVSDMRDLDLRGEYDAIILVGRILSYMYTNADVARSLGAFKKTLKRGGILIFDSYEIGKIDTGEYFNGEISVRDGEHALNRISKIRIIQKSPALYSWDCVYEDIVGGKKKSYRDDGHVLRAFTKDEIKSLIEKSGLSFVEHASNFEDISFITVARKI